ncbi:MAG TPA: c-type cytochrome domain-containing protein [Candidatus Limnocylindria bacterium]|nr:c-type cytochrome domain-containing protein [Candidatus Limnocylindria bacterium]
MNRFVVALATAAVVGTPLASHAEDAVDFAKDIAPILSENCVKCHGPEKQKSKYRMDTKADAFKGGKSEKVSVVPGDPEKSELIRRITLPKDNDDLMPPEGGPLPEASIAKLRAWIKDGAKWPDGFVVAVAAAKAPTATSATERPAAPARILPPLPELPKDFKPATGEDAAIAALAKAGIDVRLQAANGPWREVNLRLKGAEVTDKTIEPLKGITSLVEVRLGTTKVTDAGLASLKSLQYLEVLGLEQTAVTDAGLANLKDLNNLTYINLFGTQVTDAGLEYLKGMKHLRSVYLWQSKATEAGAEKLRAALPGVDVNLGWKEPEKKEEPKKEEAKKDEAKK